MTTPEAPSIVKMQVIIEKWKATEDARSIFLVCYQMMTRNVLSAILQHEFNDPAWVESLQNNFASYYFNALAAYERNPLEAPLVWQYAHNSTRNPGVLGIQRLLLGVNAHINYDLVLALVDLLRPEWNGLTPSHRAARYADHCHINEIISQTIDAVQDNVLEPAMPVLDLFDKILGPADEYIISHLLTHWREAVWQNAVRLLETQDLTEQARLIKQVEGEALRIGTMINLGRTQAGREVREAPAPPTGTQSTPA